MRRKLLFLDLDGTLLDSAKRVSAANRDALSRALALGHGAVITTGRPLRGAMALAQSLGLAGEGCYIVAFNGGLIYDCTAKSLLSYAALPRETALEALQICDEFGVHAQTYDETGVVVTPRWDDATLRRYCALGGGLPSRVIPAWEQLDAPPCKVLAASYADHAALRCLADSLAPRLHGRASCFFSCPDYFEIMPLGVSKGTALETLCGLLRVPREDSIAVGDEENDLPMLRRRGLGAGMLYSSARGKQASDFETARDYDHDGVAEVIQKFMLP